MNRRSFLWNYGGGLGGVALAHLMGREALGAGRDGPSSTAGCIIRPRPSALSNCSCRARRASATPSITSRC